MDRRDLLKALPAVIVGLAGCTGGQSTPEPTATAMPTGTAEPTDAITDTTGTQTGTAETTPTDAATATPMGTPAPVPDAEVIVGPGGNLRFEPPELTVHSGDTIRWTWASAGHNIKHDDGAIPPGADWQGTPGSRTTTYDEGYTLTHTFTTKGRYEYYCVPHRSSGMTASFTVE
jgi:plastocyanin